MHKETRAKFDSHYEKDGITSFQIDVTNQQFATIGNTPSQQRLLPSQRVSQGRCVLRSDNHFQKGSFKLHSIAINRIYLKPNYLYTVP